MEIETVEDLCEQIADWCGIYGGCKCTMGVAPEACPEPEEGKFCCRVGFVNELRERMGQAVKNNDMLGFI